VSYRDAVLLLGGDPPALAALDRVLAGALSLGTGGVSDVALSVFDAQPRIVLLGRDLVHKLRDRLHGASRADRTQRSSAASCPPTRTGGPTSRSAAISPSTSPGR
jgi:hypothetical protein